MSEASLAAQRLAVVKMRARPALTALVPAANIFDKNALPEVFPCIIIGEAQTVGDDIQCADISTVHLTMHVWTTENGLSACKNIAGEVRRALRDVSEIQEGFALDFNFSDSIFMRDPDGLHSHGVVNFEVLAEDTVGI